VTTEELADRWMTAVNDLALLFAHEPADKVEASLAQVRQNLNVDFCALFPTAPAAILAAGVASIITEILKRRREIEAAGAMPPVLN
jgi:hypothetical protein